MLAALALIAIVVQDQTPLVAAPDPHALQHTMLWQGDALEVRGERIDYLQVYDHRRERAGYVRAVNVRTYPVDPSSAPELLAVVRFLRETSGAEALGIGYVALFLKAAPAEALGPEIYDALGTFADRLARRGSSARAKQGEGALAAHLEVAAGYGVEIRGIERDGRMRLCYEGDAFRRVLALPVASDGERARAALGLTRPECASPDSTPTDRAALDQWRADVLDRVSLESLPAHVANRIRLRRAGVWASLVVDRARRGEPAREAGARAIRELAGVDKAALTEDDQNAYTEAAVRVGASRWGSEEPVAAPGGKLSIVTAPGEPGGTCVKLVDAKHDAAAPLFERCTYGVVWAASARSDRRGNVLALAVQPLDAWRELWVFHRIESGWTADVLTPSASGPDLGYSEFAGFSPDASRVLVAREARVDGRFERKFEIVRLDTLEVEKKADKPEALTPFYRWQDPLWKRQTLAIR